MQLQHASDFLLGLHKTISFLRQHTELRETHPRKSAEEEFCERKITNRMIKEGPVSNCDYSSYVAAGNATAQANNRSNVFKGYV